MVKHLKQKGVRLVSNRLEKEITEWATWYHYNRDVLSKQDLEQKVNFLARACDGMMACLATAMEDIAKLENRNTLILPTEVRAEHYVKRSREA